MLISPDGRFTTHFGPSRFPEAAIQRPQPPGNFPVERVASTRVISCLVRLWSGWISLTFTTGDANLNTPTRVSSSRLKTMHGHRVANLE
jgi:hypothetical protein